MCGHKRQQKMPSIGSFIASEVQYGYFIQKWIQVFYCNSSALNGVSLANSVARAQVYIIIYANESSLIVLYVASFIQATTFIVAIAAVVVVVVAVMVVVAWRCTVFGFASNINQSTNH